MSGTSSNAVGRRQFLAGTAAAAACTIVRPSAVRGSRANSAIEVALLGCGGRGTWITDLFSKHGGYRWAACCDYYPDQVARVGEKLKIDPAMRFTGLGGYKRMYEKKFDAVVIETPPYFHPIHAADAVQAGKHVYCAKPIAVDVPGCKSIEASAQEASGKKLCFLIDFQTRANEYYREAARRVHAGAIGKLVCGDASYPCGVIAMEAPKTPEERLRRWYCNKALSGDFIVEQSIHSIDVTCWMINAAPVAAVGCGASKGLRRYGDIYDCFTLVYEFPGDVGVSFYCEQMCHRSPNEITSRIYGSDGTFDSDYFSHVWVHTPPDNNYEGKFSNLYTDGTIVNIKEFHEALMKGDCSNPTVKPSVVSNLSAILGRNAAYRRERLTWEQLMKDTERLKPDLGGLKS